MTTTGNIGTMTDEELRAQIAAMQESTRAMAETIATLARRHQRTSGVAQGPVEEAIRKLADSSGVEVPEREPSTYRRARVTANVTITVPVSFYTTEDIDGDMVDESWTRQCLSVSPRDIMEQAWSNDEISGDDDTTDFDVDYYNADYEVEGIEVEVEDVEREDEDDEDY